MVYEELLPRWRVSMRRGKKLTTRKILTVIEIEHEYFVVVMAEVKDRYAILTAYPSNREHYDHCIKSHGVNMGIWGEGEIGKSRISGSEAGRAIDRG